LHLGLLPDLEGALKSFQQAFARGEIELHRGTLDPNIYLHLDRPNGEMRMTYVRVSGGVVTAMVTFIQCEPVEGERCYNIGWAVPPDMRGQGRAGEAFLAATKELRHGLARHGISAFYVEGIVDVENAASRRVAERVISPGGDPEPDSFTGVPIVQYLRRITADTVL
jgi:RimJ/RimL family protein N-acetyltransferase